jgi:hypothetical protein
MRTLGFVLAVIVALIGAAVAQTTFSNPVGTAVNATTGDTAASRQVVGSNPTRRSIAICNPSSVIWWIAPSPITAAANGAGSYGLPAASSGTTVCYTSPSGFPNSVGNAWNAIPASTPATLSIFEWN